MMKKRLLAVIILLTVLLLSMGAIGTSLAAEGDNPYPNTKLVVNALRMEDISNTDTPDIQGFVSLHLDGIPATGIAFTMRYQKDLLEPSFAADNSVPTVADNRTSIDAAFVPAAQLQLPGTGVSPLISIYNDKTNANYGFLEVLLLPEPLGSGVFHSEVEGGLDIGELSFKVKDISQLAQLDQAALDNMLSLYNVTDSSVGNPTGQRFMINYSGGSYESVENNWDYGVQLTPALKEVSVDMVENMVSAADIYNDGTQNDLVAYLNSAYSEITLSFIDGTRVAGDFIWDAAQLQVTEVWNPKGGTYHVTQPYNETVDVTFTLQVLPVQITGYQAANDYLTYADKAGLHSLADLSLPSEATPIFDRVIGVNHEALPVIDWVQAAPDPTDPTNDFFAEGSPDGEYTFLANVTTNNLAPWVTVPDSFEHRVQAKRFVGQASPKPVDIMAQVADDGVLTVQAYLDNGAGGHLAEIPAGTIFSIKLPDGTEIDPAGYSVNIVDDLVTIKISQTSNPHPLTGQYLNLGGDFKIAAQVPDCSLSEYVAFALSPGRTNYYTGADYTFDYTGLRQGMFPVAPVANGAQAVVDTTVNLPGGDHITTTYNGVTGDNNGFLTTFQVDDWQLEAGSGDPTQYNQVLIYKGSLADTEYPEYGMVKNGDSKTVTLKLQTAQIEPTYRVTLNSNDTALGTVSLTGGPEFAAGDIVTIGYTEVGEGRFQEWQVVSGNLQASDIQPLAEMPGVYTFVMPASNVTLKGVFTTSSSGDGALEDIIIRQVDEDADDSNDRIFDKYTDKLLTPPAVTLFDPETKTYFVRVPNEATQVKLWVKGGQTITLAYDDNDDTTGTESTAIPAVKDEVDSFWKTDPILLEEVNLDLGDEDHKGFNNTIEIKVGEGDNPAIYKVHIQRLAKARIDLNYGNSPYGMIMSEPGKDEAWRTAAKEAFDTNDKFTTDYLPTGASTKMKYTTAAWAITGGTEIHVGDKKYSELAADEYMNFDKDDKAIFVKLGDRFRDPGFTVTNSLGQTVTLSETEIVKRDLSVDIMNAVGINGILNNITTNYVLDTAVLKGGADDNIVDLSTIRVLPGIYTIHYVYEDSIIGEVTEERVLISLSKNGDVNLDTYVSISDGSLINNNASNKLPDAETAPNKRTGLLYSHRISDINGDNYITIGDGSLANNNSSSPITNYYLFLSI